MYFVPAQKVVLITVLILSVLLPRSVGAYDAAATESAKINISARVNPKPKHFQFNFTSDLVNSTTGADREITYTITYGSLIDYGTPMTITASWSLGTVWEEYLTNYEILSYAAGSATRDYWGKSVPVVDIKHRTITWIIDRFPPNTIDKTLSFKLRTPGRYVTDKLVNFKVTANMKTEQIDVGTITLDQTYNPSEFIRTEVSGLKILSADIRKITDTSFSIYLVTSVPAKTVIYYGLDPNNLDKIVSEDNLVDTKIITITGLIPATTYYFKILIENDKGIQRKTPEIFLVTTAEHSIIARIDLDRFMATSKGVSVKKGYDTEGNISLLVPAAKNIDFYIPFYANPPALVFLSLGFKNVLGISTDTSLDITKIRLLETESGVVTGRLAIPKEPGVYDLIFEANDLNGTINQDILASITVSPSITILTPDNKPVEKAMIYIERYNLYQNSFETFPAESYGSKNPIFTDGFGEADMVLPLGEYKININALGFKPIQHRFTLSNQGNQLYPKLILETEPFNLFHFISYYRIVFRDWLDFVSEIVNQTGLSPRFMDLSLGVGIIILTLMSMFLNLKRIRLNLEGLYILIERRLLRLKKGRTANRIFIGFIEDNNTGTPVYHAVCYLIRLDNKSVAVKDMTNHLGEFHLNVDPGRQYLLLIKKPGYVPYKLNVDASVLFESIPAIQMERTSRPNLPEPIVFTGTLITILFHAFSDSLVFGVTIFNIYLTTQFGLNKMLPIMLITLLNFYLFLQYHWVKFKISRR